MNRRTYLRRWLRALSLHEQKLLVKAARSRNAFIRAAAKSYENNGVISNHLQEAHQRQINTMLLEHYRKVMPYFGKVATKELKARHRTLELKDSHFLVRLLEWASTRALQHAKTIAATDMDEVRGIIEHGIDEGLGTEEIGRNIRKASERTPSSAARIARTETHSAATYGAIETARQAEEEIGIKLVKEWVPTVDGRTRPEHAAMASAQPIPLDEQFDVGGEMLDRPGDPSGSPENVINCRCAILTEEAPE